MIYAGGKQLHMEYALVDPQNAHPHDPDIQTLQRVCNVHAVPLATNLSTAELIVQPKTIREHVD